jgi:hypothetical protein
LLPLRLVFALRTFNGESLERISALAADMGTFACSIQRAFSSLVMCSKRGGPDSRRLIAPSVLRWRCETSTIHAWQPVSSKVPSIAGRVAVNTARRSSAEDASVLPLRQGAHMVGSRDVVS